MKRTRKVLSRQLHAERFNLRILAVGVGVLLFLWLIGRAHLWG